MPVAFLHSDFAKVATIHGGTMLGHNGYLNYWDLQYARPSAAWPIGKFVHAKHLIAVAKCSIAHEHPRFSWRLNRQHRHPIAAVRLKFPLDLVDDAPALKSHALVDVLSRLDNVLRVLAVLNFQIARRLFQSHNQYHVQHIAQRQTLPIRHCCLVIDDQYRWHGFFADTVQTGHAAAAWNPCPHYSQLTKCFLGESTAFVLRRES